MTISFIIPVHNEALYLEKKLASFISGIKKLKVKFKIILVENGSNDQSFNLIKHISQKNKNITFIKIPDADYGLALRTGFLASKTRFIGNLSVDWLDVDFIREAQAKLPACNIIIASKNLKNSRDRRGKFRRYGSRFFHFLVRILFKVKISDTHGIKMLNTKKVLPIIKKCRLNGELFDTELIIRSCKSGLNVCEIPAHVRETRSTRVKFLKRIFKGIFQLFYLKYILLKEEL